MAKFYVRLKTKGAADTLCCYLGRGPRGDMAVIWGKDPARVRTAVTSYATEAAAQEATREFYGPAVARWGECTLEVEEV